MSALCRATPSNPDGVVYIESWMRIAVELNEELDLHWFPFDIQDLNVRANRPLTSELPGHLYFVVVIYKT